MIGDYYELRITNYELQITNYKLQITNYELQIANYELQVMPKIYRPVDGMGGGCNSIQ